MDQLVIYATSLDRDLLSRALPAVSIRTVYSRFSLVEAIVEQSGLLGVLVDLDELSDEWAHFLTSAHQSFPRLRMLVTAHGGGCLEGIPCLDLDADSETLRARIADAYAGNGTGDRRQHHRYSWPLRATLDGEGTVHRIEEISAGGAFLDPTSPVPAPGSRCTIRVEFQNFTLTTQCEILDPRHVSSRSGPGFGVRFTELSERGREFIARIVNDALAQLLLDPGARPQVPTIDDVEEVLEVGDEFSLSL